MIRQISACELALPGAYTQKAPRSVARHTRMRLSRSPILYWLLAVYILVSLTYQVIASVSLITGYFDLRHQIQEPFKTDFNTLQITDLTPGASAAGLRIGDRLESLNGEPYHGRAQWQSIRWYARPGDRISVGAL